MTVVFVNVVAFGRKKCVLTFQIDAVNCEIAFVAGDCGVEFSACWFECPVGRCFLDDDVGTFYERAFLCRTGNFFVRKSDDAFGLFADASSGVVSATGANACNNCKCIKKL